MRTATKVVAPALLLFALASILGAQAPTLVDVTKRLDGLDEYMSKVLKDWNGLSHRLEHQAVHCGRGRYAGR